MNYKILNILFFLFFFHFYSFAKDGISVKVDSIFYREKKTENALDPAILPSNFKEKYKGDDFDYTENQVDFSFLEKLQKKIYNILEFIFGDIKTDSYLSFLKLLYIGVRVLGILVLAWVVYLLVRLISGKRGNWFFSKKNKSISINEELINEDIHQIDFKEVIKKNENEKNYRMAIRYHFLWKLKELSEKNIIAWNIEKTNADYYREIQGESERNLFGKWVYIFDNVWYGNFEINEKKYQKYINIFLK